MIEEVVTAVVSSIILAILAEVWTRRRAFLEAFKGRSAQAAPTAGTVEQSTPAPMTVEQTGTAATPLTTPTPLEAEDVAEAAPSVAEVPPPTTPAPPQTQSQGALSRGEIGRAIARLVIAALAGFIIGGLVAGIMEAEGQGEIALGSGIALELITVATLLVWVLLYRFGPLKSRTTRR